MRVIQAMAGAEYGGAEAFFCRLAIALQRTGLEQRIVIRENERRARLLRSGGVDPVELPFGGKFDFKTGLGLRREIREFKPDIVLTWMNRATQKCPRGKFVHVARLGGYYDIKYYRKCRHLIGNTQDIVDYLVENGWPKERVHYLPNFVSGEQAEPLSRESMYTPPAAQVVLALGRLHENKAFDVLLNAMVRVPNAYLWIAGEGPRRADLEKLAANLAVRPRVRFLGWRDDVAALFAACDLFVCSSRHEPLGNVVIEAWAQGVPVVSSDSLGPGTLITHMDNGVLVPVDDPAALGQAIKAVLDDRGMADKLARRGYETYYERFTEQAVVKRYMDFFERVVG
jgi:glycosyltransferase involved in cell wall biosynthesis